MSEEPNRNKEPEVEELAGPANEAAATDHRGNGFDRAPGARAAATGKEPEVAEESPREDESDALDDADHGRSPEEGSSPWGATPASQALWCARLL